LWCRGASQLLGSREGLEGRSDVVACDDREAGSRTLCIIQASAKYYA